MKHEILALDVWGNARDGYEINDMHTTGIELNLDSSMSDAEIIKAVRKACGHRADARGYVVSSTGCVKDSDVCIDRASDGKPAYYTRVLLTWED